MKETKTVCHIFDASAFDEELGFLNEMSEKGWQLSDMDMRWFSQKYVWDDSVVYRYAIDYQDLSVGEFKQYRAEFEDQGWSFVTHRGSWYFFRKPYDPGLLEDEYLIYTDDHSFRDMKRSINMAVNIFGIMYLPNGLMHPNVSFLLLASSMILAFVDSICRRRRLKRVCRKPKPYRFHLWRLSTLLMILLIIIGAAYDFIGASSEMEFNPVMRSNGPLPPLSGVQSTEITVKLPDLYGIHAYAEEADIQSVPYWVTDKDDDLVCSGVIDTKGRVNRFFWPGTYTLTVDWGPAPVWHASRWATIGYPGSLLPDVPFGAYIVWIFGWWAVYFIIIAIQKKKR